MTRDLTRIGHWPEGLLKSRMWESRLYGSERDGVATGLAPLNSRWNCEPTSHTERARLETLHLKVRGLPGVPRLLDRGVSPWKKCGDRSEPCKGGIDGKRFRRFAGYAAFSVSFSRIQQVRHYIENQKPRHQKRTFKEELVWLLKMPRVDFDERYLWD